MKASAKPPPPPRRSAWASRICIVAVLALALAGLSPAVEPAAAAVARPFVGLQGWAAPGSGGFHRVAQARVGYWRAVVSWAEIERGRGSYDWTSADQLFARASAAGVRVLPVMIGSPTWAASKPQWPPRGASERTAYARWVGAAVGRYGPGGTFWRERPGLGPGPAPTHWQIWNEPNLPNYWNGRPSARQYGALLRLASRAARAASPRVRIVLAGLPESAAGVPIATYLKGLERSRSTRRAYHVVAVHPYARNHRGVLGALDRVKAVLRRYRDTRKATWVTEVGWATGPRRDDRGFVTSEAGQASRLGSTYRALWRARRRYRLLGAIWFSFQDPALRPGDFDWWAVHTGLLRT
ncbi:MAG: beta-galactosidase, partial [Actinomycetota bacterium]|nr:beta-galactosidase [Actinomycetota bacterium]